MQTGMIIRNILLSILFLAINYKVFFVTLTAANDIFLTIYQICIYFIIFSLVTYIASFNKQINNIFIIFLLLLSLVSVYFENTMGIIFDKQIIKNIAATNIKEVNELVGIHFYFYFLSVLIFSGLVYKYFLLKQERITVKIYFLIIFSHIILFFAISQINYVVYKTIIKNDIEKIVPLGPIKAYIHYLRTKSREEVIVKENISKYFHHKTENKEPLIVILVIGESARADRFSLNGYKRETTPRLAALKNLVSYSNASSCSTSTQSSVPCLLGRSKFKDFSFPISEVSFIEIFKEAGFQTYWISIQDESNSIATFAQEADYQIDLKDKKYDADILDAVDKALQINKNTLLVLHTNGSHMDYNKKVPDDLKIFKPLCNDDYTECTKISLDNSYDNTIYYTDFFLESLIKKIQHKNAFFIYTSDHGESLGEKYAGFITRYGHASPYHLAPIEQTHIPLIAWFSNDFLDENNLTMKSFDKSSKVSHDNIFNSMLGCAGFISDTYLEKDLNICQE